MLGGGASATGNASWSRMLWSAPTDAGTAWIGGIKNDGPKRIRMYAWAICANVS